MATVKKGITATSPEWWKHLRKYVHRRFWKRQRQADKREERLREIHDAACRSDAHGWKPGFEPTE